MRKIVQAALGAGLLTFCAPLAAQQAAEAVQDLPSAAVIQLRHVVGEWDVATTFHGPDGAPGQTLDGVYSFEWVLEDKIVKGMSTIPQLEMASGLLLYVRPSTSEIEMVSVGPDGRLWTMTGPQDSETRETPVVDLPNGNSIKLRFTRFNVTPDRFESRMELSSDGGETWIQGNHQLFVRREESES